MKKTIKIITSMSFFVSVLFIVFCYGYSYAATHYVSTTGGTNWSASTNISTPCNIATAFTNAAAGDIVYLRGGTYTNLGPISTPRSGNSSQKITFMAYTGETPLLSGTTEIVIGHNYWVIQGITFSSLVSSIRDNSAAGAITLISGSSHNEIRNCDFNGGNTATGRESAIWGENSTYNTIDSNTIHHWGSNSTGDSERAMIAMSYQASNTNACSYNIISNNKFHDWASYGVLLYPGHHNQILNNIFDQSSGGYGLGISIGTWASNAHHNLVDGNTFIGFNTTSWSGNAKAAIQLDGTTANTIRRNVFRDFGNGNPTWAIEMGTTAGNNSTNNYIYNNTFYNTPREAITMTSSAQTGNKFYNNIFWKVHTNTTDDTCGAGSQGSAFEILASGSQPTGTIIDHNFVLYNSSTSTDIVCYMGPAYYTLSEIQAAQPTIWRNNINTATGPGFVDAGNHNFNLVSGSPCINAGFIVTDANAAAGGWSNLTYQGSAPDIGAYEYGGSSPPPSPPPGDTSAPSPPSGLKIIPQ